MNKVIVKLAASLLIAAALIFWLSSQGFEVLPGMDEITRVAAYWAIPVYGVVFTIFHILRAWRWMYLLRPFAKVRFSTMMEVAFLGFAAHLERAGLPVWRVLSDPARAVRTEYIGNSGRCGFSPAAKKVAAPSSGPFRRRSGRLLFVRNCVKTRH